MNPKYQSLIVILIFIFSNPTLKADEAQMTLGLQVFNQLGGCAACHSLNAAGAAGEIGPNLDQLMPSIDYVRNMVQYGLGAMPAYGEDGILTPEQIEAVSFYVANASGK